MAVLTNFPGEILDQIIDLLPSSELVNVSLSHSKLYNCANPRVYRSVHFVGPGEEGSLPYQWPFDETYSTAIADLGKFTRTLLSSELFRSFVFRVGFRLSTISWFYRREVTTILKLVEGSLKVLHFAPTLWDPNIHMSFPVTSVDVVYPVLFPMVPREAVHSLFLAPTLRRITLRQLGINFEDENPPFNGLHVPFRPDKRKVQTSNVEFLAVKDTNSNENYELQEVMTWPKALRAFDCTLGLNTENHTYALDPSRFVGILRPQAATLEELTLDLAQRSFTRGTLGTSLHEFANLKRISMPRNFLACTEPNPVTQFFSPRLAYEYADRNFRELHLALPATLEELILNVDVDTEKLQEGQFPGPHFKEWIEKVALHKQELYPSLRRMILWQVCQLQKYKSEEVDRKEREMIEFLDISLEFQHVGVQFLYQVRDKAPVFRTSVCGSTYGLS